MNHSQTAAKILIVDDAASLRAVLRAFFTKEGYAVVGELASGATLPEAMVRLNPNIVCLDYNLPEVNGMDLLKSLQVSHPTVAVVMITGDTTPELETLAAEAGAAGFLRKPFTQNRMAQEMRQVVAAQSLLQRHAAGKAKAIEQVRGTALVIDDSATMRTLLGAILHQAQVKVVGTASDGKQGIELACELQPDIICLDMQMPVMNGMQVLEELCASKVPSKALMITSSSERELVMQALKNGAHGYILKPFEPDKVVEAVVRLLSPT